MSYTTGEFATALGGIVSSLNGIAEELSHCDLKAEIDSTPGRTVICQVPIFRGGICAAEDRDSFTVADLNETIGGLRDWVLDVQTKLGSYDPATPLDSGTWSPPNESTSA